jgi:hypothetical protein
VQDPGGAHLSNVHQWRLEAWGHAASRGVGRARVEEGADVRAAANDCGGGEVHVGADIHPCGGGDAARRGEVGGAPTAASMKGPRWLHRRGPGTGAVAGSRRRR